MSEFVSPSGSDARLKLAIATPLPADAEAVLRAEPRIELLFDPTLLPTQRFPSDHYGDPSFTRTPEQEAAFDALLARADAVYGIPDEDPAQVARVCTPSVRWVATTAAGGGSLIGAAGLERSVLDDVAFTSAAGVHARPLAEFALLGVLAGFQRVPELRAQQAAHAWPERHDFPRGLRGARILVLGLGHIGTEVSRLLTSLGAVVTGTSRHETSHPHTHAVVHPDRLAEAAAEADALIVTLPGTHLTRGMVSAEVIAALPAGATVVNVGRGTVIDEAALTDALRSGHVGFAALDVFEVEPLPDSSPLWDLPNVLVSPHAATMNRDEDRLIAELLVANALRLLDGEPLLNRIDTHEFY